MARFKIFLCRPLSIFFYILFETAFKPRIFFIIKSLEFLWEQLWIDGPVCHFLRFLRHNSDKVKFKDIIHTVVFFSPFVEFFHGFAMRIHIMFNSFRGITPIEIIFCNFLQIVYKLYSLSYNIEKESYK